MKIVKVIMAVHCVSFAVVKSEISHLNCKIFPFAFCFPNYFEYHALFHEFYSAFVINANIKYLQTESHAKSGQNTYNSII